MEICDVNRFYGHAHIIKEYCDFPMEEPVPLAIQHGAGRYRRKMSHEHSHEALFDYWVYCEQVKENAQKILGISPSSLHVLGAPFAYLVRHLNYQAPPPNERKGSIAFPDHSIPDREIIGKYEEYASELASLPSEFHPITVSVHPHDIRLGKHQSFLEHGLEVITCGDASPLQINFLRNFIHFCHGKKYITANCVSSACTYGMYLGLQYFCYSSRPLFKKLNPNIIPEDHEDHDRIRDLYNLDTLQKPGMAQEQLEFANKDLGHSNLLSPEDLRTYLLDIRSTRKYIDKIKPLFAHLSKQCEKAMAPSGPMVPLKKDVSAFPNTTVQQAPKTLAEFLSREIQYAESVEERTSLDSVTAACVSSIELPDCIRALYRSSLHFKFSKILLFTSEKVDTEALTFFPELSIISIPAINSTQSYSQFILSELPRHVDTEHCLLLQNDGYILNEDKWSDDFLQYDYIGAPWPPALPLVGRDGKPTAVMNMANTRVGNGGFSIRSKKLMELTSLLDLSSLQLPTQSEDLIICHFYNEWFRSQGIQYAPLEVAARFSHECPIQEIPANLNDTFGYHGKNHVNSAHQIWNQKLTSST